MKPSPRRYLAEQARVGRDLSLRRDVLLGVDGDGWIDLVEPDHAGGAHDERVTGVVVPGLVDAHVHLTMSGGSDAVDQVRSMTPASAAVAALRNARAHVAHGVTTVRDLGSPGDVVTEVALAPPPAPAARIVPAGAITTTCGHADFLSRTADGPEEFRRAVRAVAGTGARWVKVFATGGVITPGSVPGARQMHDDELEATVAAARFLGLQVAAHAHGREGILAAIRAGCDSVEHVSDVDDEVIAAFQATSTLPVVTYVATHRFCHHPAIDDAPVETVAKVRHHDPMERRSMAALVEAGLPVAVGSDAGTFYNPHGPGLADQARLLGEAGMAPEAVLRGLTVRGADLLQEPVGVLEPGRRADWVAYDRDPADGLELLASPREVFLGGARAA